ncbi:MAG: hypothetical protein HN981_01975 [Candidatus Pacebacteria bacterium]|jgi:hypothetical protein|nr:hypothetical protein [Candidatus Paceibacterota bacterium]MBT4652774.1 hypothetical protein [Candidatus Paceibacterota bacterium]MBT6755931.1 hypothetical protein [Candidatus Paceibacterota bacterium]MBT6921144.1 hypothetical protein [Candidatus Paceibacterota bacterium]
MENRIEQPLENLKIDPTLEQQLELGKNNQPFNKILIGLLIVLVLIVVGFGGYILGLSRSSQANEIVDQLEPSPSVSLSASPTPIEEEVVCTYETKECPDGSYVGRMLPDCEFEECFVPELRFNEVPDPNQMEEGVVCTLDALECPDGSYVGRTGSNCEFVCPIKSEN